MVAEYSVTVPNERLLRGGGKFLLLPEDVERTAGPGECRRKMVLLTSTRDQKNPFGKSSGTFHPNAINVGLSLLCARWRDKYSGPLALSSAASPR